MPRGTSYCSAEDQFIARAWRRISGDAIVGRDQKADAFWTRIADKYMVQIQGSNYVPLSADAIKNRFLKTLAPAYMKFQSFHKRAEDLDPSGVTNIEEVVLESALKMSEVGQCRYKTRWKENT
jgi:hypothetical protein